MLTHQYLQQALNFAQKEFAEELSEVSRDRISFNISAPVNGERRSVRISESAWPAAVARLLRGEVIDIHLRPLPLKDQPPQYLEVPDPTSQLSRSSPPSRTHSREGSPSCGSEKPRSWFGKFYRIH